MTNDEDIVNSTLSTKKLETENIATSDVEEKEDDGKPTSSVAIAALEKPTLSTTLPGSCKIKGEDDDDATVASSIAGISTVNLASEYDAMTEIDKQHIISLLRRRAAHLPGNNWHQDWLQYFCNNHPFLGLFLHHPLHPLLLSQRIYIFIASLSFGLLVTSVIFLHYMYSTENFDEKVILIYLQIKDGTFSPLVISRGMISLWLNNGILHAMFDVSLWHLSACTCFSSRRNHRSLEEIGSFVVVAISGMLAACGLCAVVVRALAMEMAQANDDNVDWSNIQRWEAFAFLVGFFVELIGVYFLVYPLVITVIFSGVFGCFPGKLGGRPRDLQIEMNRLLQERNMMYNQHEIV